MHASLASPLTIACAGSVRSDGILLPSINTCVGRVDKAIAARVMPRMVAWKMLMRSISSTSTTMIDQASACAWISGINASRRLAVSTLESASPAIGRAGSRMTAATTTGPASGPRPASSMPAT
ncbi:MAG: hypothetical protein IPO66_19770 [Rhodanobacteraceae bacterium]|nr:hypothetical protein [Rhodanobacteraceae bacterium]